MTRTDWAEHARRLRERAAADAERRTTHTGEPHANAPGAYPFRILRAGLVPANTEEH